MKRLRRWIAARLWRRLAFSHFVMIAATLWAVQVAGAVMVIVAGGTATPLEQRNLALWVRFLIGSGLGAGPALLIGLLVAGLSGLLVSRSLGRRLEPLEETARKMAGGDLALRIADILPDEIGRVGQAFNRMADQLEYSLQALEIEKEQVETLLKARRDLVANVSHDLRTPIASISAHLETLVERPERLDEYLPVLTDETARISGLLADLFELSRLDAHELRLDLAPVVLADVVDKVVGSCKAVAWEQRRIVLEAHLPASLPLVRADVQRVEQILFNLISNGLRFTPEGGIVTIEAGPLVGEVEVRVSDTGIGILPKDLPHIFERSYGGDRSRWRPEPGERLISGSGLGLAIVKGLVEAMGGTVGATSTPGEGTCIRFRLPMVDGQGNLLRCDCSG